MELKFSASIELSQADLQLIIEDAVERRYQGVKVIDVEYVTTVVTYPHGGFQIGIQPDPRPVTRLISVKVTVEKVVKE